MKSRKNRINKLGSLLAAAALALAAPAMSQAQAKVSSEDYARRYELLVSKLGPAGLGVETLLDRWGNDHPDDLQMLLGKFTYCLYKSQTSDIEVKPVQKYLGKDPVLTLKDSLQNDVRYFQVVNYDDDLFGRATSAIDKAIELNPQMLDLRFLKVSAFIDYEKESPDLALSYLSSLVDYHFTSKPKWTYPDFEVDDAFFQESVQEYCYTFFKIASAGAFEAFRALSEKMLSYCPDSPVFQTNLGSYQLVCKKDSKAALKIYNKVLKKHPGDYSTIKNCVLLARTRKDTKLERKYLPMLVKATENEAERASAEARLKALSK